MNLNLSSEVGFQFSPYVSLHLSANGFSIPTEALLDTGADICLFDLSLASILRLGESNEPSSFPLSSVYGDTQRIPTFLVHVALILESGDDLSFDLRAGFVNGLYDAVGGNVLGLNFFELIDFGLAQSRRRAYFGAAS